MSDARRPIEPLPAIPDLLLNISLYERFEITEENAVEMAGIENFGGPLDAFCISCKQNSVFRKRPEDYPMRLPFPAPDINATNRSGAQTPHPPPPPKVNAFIQERILSLEFVCTRDDSHKLYFYFRIANKIIIKIGQFPSIADLLVKEIDKYKTILGKDRYSDFVRAIGLFSHGIGVGSFVYLRRIFEDLIEQAHVQSVSEAVWDEGLYNRSRMEEKIALLKDKLPSFLVENKSLYSILSKGIHSLAEEECKKYFSIVRAGIELILDEKIEEQERRKKLERIQKSISDIKTNLS